MTAHEWAVKTCEDLQKRKAIKRRAENEADSFIIDRKSTTKKTRRR